MPPVRLPVRLPVIVAAVLVFSLTLTAHAQTLSGPLVRLDQRVPSIQIIMDYASTGNATGQVLPGYAAPYCWLVPEAASALVRVQNKLKSQGLELVIHDCYRPARAVRALLTWAQDRTAHRDLGPYNPATPRGALIRKGYIAKHSRHSLGLAVDLELARVGSTASSAVFQDCRQPEPGALDLGTRFDCFDPASATDAPTISAIARQDRTLLRDTMAAAGFHNYAREWWHYEYRGPTTTQPITLDLPIVP